jgi:hypothetical protein
MSSSLDVFWALDDGLLALDIAALTTACDLLVDGADAELPDPVPESARRSDYALAAGAESGSSTPVLVRGSGGWDWRNCPPGLVDASEQAVSWEVRRDAARSLVHVFAVAAPHLRGPVPAHLRPYARIGAGSGTTATALTLSGDDWTGSIAVPGAEHGITVDIVVPGVGYGTDSAAEAALRAEIRQFATDRLQGVLRTGDIELLRAETSAAEPDF